ncbi:MAG: sugar transferase [Spirochaetes bacterium]|nr:sugar transferase [Spirochaetota bacterium]
MHTGRRNALLVIDLLVFVGAVLLSFRLRSTYNFGLFITQAPVRVTTELLLYFGGFLALYGFLCYGLGLYEENLRWSFRQHLTRLIVISLLLFGAITITFYLTNPFAVPRSNLIVFLAFNALGELAIRLLFFQILFRDSVKRVLVIGRNDKTLRLLRELRRQAAFRTRILGVLDESAERPGGAADHYVYRVIGKWVDADRIIREQRPDLVLLSVETLDMRERILEAIDSRTVAGTFLYLDPGVYEIMIGQPQYIRIGDIPFVRIRKSISNLYDFKRLADFFMAMSLFLLTAPLMAALLIAVRANSKGPGIFAQARVGRYERPFRIFKFRTMYVEDEHNLSQAKSGDPRITPLGRFLRRTRLDELPQLVNIIRGEMSFIGPRPLIAKEVDAFKKSVPGFGERFIALPGLSGLAQVHGDYHTGPVEKLKYDLWYCYHYHPWLDVTILLRTVKTVLMRQGT